MNAPRSPDPRVCRLADWYEQLSPDTLAQIDTVYAADAWFKDPFNEVRGCAAIRAIFEHMYRQLQAPRFVVHQTAKQGDTAFLSWTLHYRVSARSVKAATICGCTELRFDAAGRVSRHRDYWDVAEELYEKQPVLGAVMRALKRRLKA